MGNSLQSSNHSSCLFVTGGHEDDPSLPPALLSCLAAEAGDEDRRHGGYYTGTRTRGMQPPLFRPFLQPLERGVGGRWGIHHQLQAGFGSMFPQSESEAVSTSLLVAAFNGREDKIQQALSNPVTNPNVSYSNGNTPLIIAVQENHTRVVHMLLARPDIMVNLRGLDGYTALIRACYERSDLVRVFLARDDIDVNLATYYGSTALTYAIRNGNFSAVQELVRDNRTNIDYQSKHGKNALFESVSYKRKDIVDLLLAAGCNVDIVDQHDRTPFLVACQYGFEDIAVALIEYGCDTSVEDDCGRNGLYHAVKRNREIVIHSMMDRKCPYSLLTQCRTVLRSYVRTIIGPGESVRRVIRRIPRTELPKTLIDFLIFET